MITAKLFCTNPALFSSESQLADWIMVKHQLETSFGEKVRILLVPCTLFDQKEVIHLVRCEISLIKPPDWMLKKIQEAMPSLKICLDEYFKTMKFEMVIFYESMGS